MTSLVCFLADIILFVYLVAFISLEIALLFLFNAPVTCTDDPWANYLSFAVICCLKSHRIIGAVITKTYTPAISYFVIFSILSTSDSTCFVGNFYACIKRPANAPRRKIRRRLFDNNDEGIAVFWLIGTLSLFPVSQWIVRPL